MWNIFADFENKLKMMGFDVNGQGTSATVDLPPGNHAAALPPKPRIVSTPSTYASKKPAAATSSSSTPSGSGGYSLYSLIKKQSQSTPATQKPVTANDKSSVGSPAKSVASSVPAGVLKKPSVAANMTAAKPHVGSAMVSHATVSFAQEPAVKSATASKVSESDFTSPHRSVLFTLFGFRLCGQNALYCFLFLWLSGCVVDIDALQYYQSFSFSFLFI